jgi:hypothetical protein
MLTFILLTSLAVQDLTSTTSNTATPSKAPQASSSDQVKTLLSLIELLRADNKRLMTQSEAGQKASQACYMLLDLQKQDKAHDVEVEKLKTSCKGTFDDKTYFCSSEIEKKEVKEEEKEVKK